MKRIFILAALCCFSVISGMLPNQMPNFNDPLNIEHPETRVRITNACVKTNKAIIKHIFSEQCTKIYSSYYMMHEINKPNSDQESNEIDITKNVLENMHWYLESYILENNANPLAKNHINHSWLSVDLYYFELSIYHEPNEYSCVVTPESLPIKEPMYSSDMKSVKIVRDPYKIIIQNEPHNATIYQIIKHPCI